MNKHTIAGYLSNLMAIDSYMQATGQKVEWLHTEMNKAIKQLESATTRSPYEAGKS